MNRKIRGLAGIITAAILCATILPPKAQSVVYAKEGEEITYKKTGIEQIYEILEEDENRTVQLGNGWEAAIDEDTSGEIFIPNDVMIYEKSKKTKTFHVVRIAKNAFKNCENIEKIHIEGEVELDKQAFEGLADSVRFETNNLETKKNLLKYGIPYEQITYTGIRTKYVALGDSIAAGYKLSGFENDGAKTPKSAFVMLTGDTLNASDGPVITDNQAVSGWTSTNLLKQLERGDFDTVLQDADVISITIGSNDLLGPFMKIVKEQFEKAGFGSLLEGGKTPGVVDTAKYALKLPGLISGMNQALKDNEQLNQACENFKNVTQPAILKKIKELAPDAKIYWTTLYNPYYGVDLRLFNVGVNLGTIADTYIRKMNEAFDTNTSGYTKVDLYSAFNTTGLTNVVCNYKESQSKLNINFDPHPNAKGQQMIAGLLTKKIQSTYVSKDPPADLMHEKAVEAFSVCGVSADINEETHEIHVTVPDGTDLSSQTVQFTVSPNAKVSVKDKDITSEETYVNLKNPFICTVTAEDETIQEYAVIVEEEHDVNTVKSKVKQVFFIKNGWKLAAAFGVLILVGGGIVVFLCIWRKKKYKNLK